MRHTTKKSWRSTTANNLNLGLMGIAAVFIMNTNTACRSHKPVAEAPVMQAQVEEILFENAEDFAEMPSIGEITNLYPKDMISNGGKSPQNVTIHNAEELKIFCTKNEIPVPEIADNILEKYDLTIVYAGQQPSGGYRISIDKVVQKPNKIAADALTILYTLHIPAADCAATDALTYPIATAFTPKNRGGSQFLSDKKDDGCK
jgi:hypothetical protein